MERLLRLVGVRMKNLLETFGRLEVETQGMLVIALVGVCATVLGVVDILT